MAKWIIDAPVWHKLDDNVFACFVARERCGLISATRHGSWFAEARGDAECFPSQSEARAWVEARVMEAMGATVARNPVYAFGTGHMVVDTGTANGCEAVFVTPVEQPGTVGQSTRALCLPLDRLNAHELVLTFPTEAQARCVADALVGATVAPEPDAEWDAAIEAAQTYCRAHEIGVPKDPRERVLAGAFCASPHDGTGKHAGMGYAEALAALKRGAGNE
jgi:hypothetical protein